MKATINGIALAYDDVGAGPAIVLVHGFPLNRRMWQPQIAELARAGYRVIAPDLRGFGESQVPDNAWSLESLASDLVGLLNYLGIGRAVFCGFAMGGSVIFHLLEQHSDRVAGACFVSSCGRGDDTVEKAERSELVDMLSAGRRGEVLSLLAGQLLGEETAVKQAELLLTLNDWLEAADTRSLIWGLQAIRDRKDFTAGLRQFFQPTLVIAGAADRIILPEHGRHPAKTAALGVDYAIPGAGHLVGLEQPENFNQCLLDFLNSILTAPA